MNKSLMMTWQSIIGYLRSSFIYLDGGEPSHDSYLSLLHSNISTIQCLFPFTFLGFQIPAKTSQYGYLFILLQSNLPNGLFSRIQLLILSTLSFQLFFFFFSLSNSIEILAMKKMAIQSMSTRLSILCLLSYSVISFAKVIPPRFPASQKFSVSSTSSTGNELYKTKYFTQILDHFNFYPKSYHTFQQRYLVNDTYWGGAKKNAPIFVYTGNEGDIEWFAQNAGFLYETAPRFKALIVFIEV